MILGLALTALSTMAAFGSGRIILTPTMLTSEGGNCDPALLVDEQTLGDAPLPVKPQTCWKRTGKASPEPIACVLDLGRTRLLGTLWLFDKNANGGFRVQAGKPGQWLDVVKDDLLAYDQWKEFRLNVRTQFLRFIKETPSSNVAEIALFEKIDSEGAPRVPVLVDDVRCGDPTDPHPFQEFPAGISRIQPLLGQPCRVLPNDEGEMKYFAYKVGGGKGLQAGAAYQLEVDYPEDAPRSIFVMNRGCEESLGFHTGPTVGDVLKGRYTFNNPESLRLPLAGQFRTWKTFFHLHDRFPGIIEPRGEGARPDQPADGFWVIIAQPRAANAPLSHGAAIARIRLLAMPADAWQVKPPTLPAGLPRRHIFCREEMGDGAIASIDPLKRGLVNVTDWYEFKARRLHYLGMDTFTTDLLEFGANQGWDSDPYGGNAWYFQSPRSTQWANILAMLGEYGLAVLPYYEYCGSLGFNGQGNKHPCVTLGGGKTYTHITWSERGNCDVTDPLFVEDVHRLLDCTIYRHKGRTEFLGAWFRQRPTHLPISFSDRCLKLFADEADGGKSVTREGLKKDRRLYERYRAWWLGKRRDFFKVIRDDLRQGSGRADAFFLFTADSSEPGLPYPDGNRPLVVTDDVATWEKLGHTAIPLTQAIAEDRQLAALTRDQQTWSWYEWQHSVPASDPEQYRDDEGIMFSSTFNRAYTVGSPRALEAFRSRAGLTLMRHYPLNENEMDVSAGGKTESKLGYFVADVERAGPYCMLAEALAMAKGDPTCLGYLSGRQYNRGFPAYVRKFNLNFLALPALPSRVVAGAAGDPEIVVRAIVTEKQGTWLAVINTGWGEKQLVNIHYPSLGEARWTNAVTGQVLASAATSLKLTLHPCQLKALRLER